VKLLEFDSHGYSVLDVTPERVQMDWFYISNRENPNAAQRFATAWLVRDGNNSSNAPPGRSAPVRSPRERFTRAPQQQARARPLDQRGQRARAGR
jgi:hypothetical protein